MPQAGWIGSRTGHRHTDTWIVKRAPQTGHSGTSPYSRPDFNRTLWPIKPPEGKRSLPGVFFPRYSIMNMKKRLLISVGILGIDLVFFFFPLSAVFLAYIILCNPRWFRDFLNNLPETHR